MWIKGRILLVLGSMIACAAVPPVDSAHAAGTACSGVAGNAVAGPTSTAAWRAEIQARTAVLYDLPGKSLRASRWLARTEAPWLLVVARPRAALGRCWLRVRLPWRPNGAAGWVNAANVSLEKTPWRIAVSTAARTLTLFHAGAFVRKLSVVVGKPSTPTPPGLFAVQWAIPWHPADFLGSWVLELAAHSDALQTFDGGDGTVGIHGRGGASLLDPLGSARSHGCIRLANDAIDWLAHTIGASRLPGTPVEIS
jgi:lipoprotein-anchoring transpeptidase ErfK/SrfK